MNETYPNDADGDALRRIAADGSNMTKPMVIDFHVAAPDRATAKAIAAAAGQRGYRTKVHKDHEGSAWTCECSKEMLATHGGVIAAQEELDDLSKPHGGHSDGWGTFGNVDEG